MTETRRDTRSKIIDVAARLLREHGASAVTTRRVAEEAGVQAPTIYRLFDDKEGLLDAVAEHVMATFVRTKVAVERAASATGVDPLEDLRAGWDMQIDFGISNPALFALLSSPTRGFDSPAAQAGKHVLEARVHRLALAGRLRVSEQRAVNLIQAAGTGAVLTLLAVPLENRDPGLPDAIYEAVVHQILTDTPDRIDSGPIATAVAFRAIAPHLQMLTEAERHLLAEWLNRTVNAL